MKLCYKNVLSKCAMKLCYKNVLSKCAIVYNLILSGNVPYIIVAISQRVRYLIQGKAYNGL